MLTHVSGAGGSAAVAAHNYRSSDLLHILSIITHPQHNCNREKDRFLAKPALPTKLAFDLLVRLISAKNRNFA